jgi:hypothetical protein
MGEGRGIFPNIFLNIYDVTYGGEGPDGRHPGDDGEDPIGLHIEERQEMLEKKNDNMSSS